MPTLFGIDVQGLIAQNLGPGAQDATLKRVVPGSYDPNDPAAGLSKTFATYSCRVYVTKFSETRDAPDLVRMYQGEVTVLLGTLQQGIVPRLGDTITTVPPGQTAAMDLVVADPGNGKAVDIDPASATAVCKVKG